MALRSYNKVPDGAKRNSARGCCSVNSRCLFSLITLIVRRFKEACIIVAISLGLLFLIEAGVRLVGSERTEILMLKGGSLAMPDSVLGHRNRPGARMREQGPEFTALYAIDGDGLRAPLKDGIEAASSDPFRILLLGDSFTFGIGNNYEETWAHFFEQRMRQQGRTVEVINAGVPGYDTRTELLYLEGLLSRLQPDVVVLAFLPNDVFTNNLPGNKPALRMVVERGEKKHVLHVVSLLQRLIARNDWLYARWYRRSARGPFFERVPPEPVVEQLNITEQLLERVHARCQEDGVALLVLSLPQQFQVLVEARSLDFENIDVQHIDERMAMVARRNGFTWITTLDTLAMAYRENGNPLYYRVDGHLTLEGNRIVGAFLAEQFGELFRDHEKSSVRSAASER